MYALCYNRYHLSLSLSLSLSPPPSLPLSLSRYIEGYAPAPIDDSQDIVNATASFSNGFTTMRFTRPLTASNPRDLSLTECRFFLYGWGGPATISTRGINYHPSTPIISTDRVCLPAPQECGESTINLIVIKLIAVTVILVVTS